MALGPRRMGARRTGLQLQSRSLDAGNGTVRCRLQQEGWSVLPSSLPSCGLLGSQESAGVTTRSYQHGKTVFIWGKKKRILKALSRISICQNDSCPLGHSPENSHSGPWPNLQKTLGTNQVLNNALIQRDYTGRPQCRTPPCSGFQPLPGPYASGGEDNEDIRTRPRPGEGRCFPAAVPATLISAEARRYSPAAPSRPSALGRA